MASGNRFRQYRTLLTRYLTPQAPWVIWIAALLLVGIILQLANPQVIRYFLDIAQAGGCSKPLLIAGSLFIDFAILQQGLTLGDGYLAKAVGCTASAKRKRSAPPGRKPTLCTACSTGRSKRINLHRFILGG